MDIPVVSKWPPSNVEKQDEVWQRNKTKGLFVEANITDEDDEIIIRVMKIKVVFLS